MDGADERTRKGTGVIDETLHDADQKMNKAIEVAKDDFATIRTGRAHPAMFSKLTADYYGTPTPIQQLASFTNPEPRTVLINVYDRQAVGAVERAIRESDLGLNPVTEGQLLRLPIPELNEERRHEIAKVAHKYTEQARIAVRNVRRDGMEHLKRMEKDGDIGKDEHHTLSTKVQELTDKVIKEIDEALASKEAEIMQV